MKPYRTYRHGQPPKIGFFATAASIDMRKIEIRPCDIIQDLRANNPMFGNTGIVIAIAADRLIYLLCEGQEQAGKSQFQVVFCHQTMVIGHAYDLLKEVVRIEAAATEKGANT